MAFNRWIVLASACLLAIAYGCGTLWGLYSPYLKDTLSLSQQQLDLALTLYIFGAGVLSIATGVFYDKFGARPTLLLGGIFTVFPFVWYYLQCNGFIKNIPGITVSVSVVEGLGVDAIYMAFFGSSLANFPSAKARISGILYAIDGLSTAFFSMVDQFFFKNNVEGFFLFIIFFVTVSVVIGLVFTGTSKAAEQPKYVNLNEANGGAPMWAHYDDDLVTGKPVPKFGMLNKSVRFDAMGAPLAQKSLSVLAILPELNSIQMIRTIDFWVFAFVLLHFQGVADLLFYQMGTIVDSELGKPPDDKNPTNLYLTVWSVISCVSTILTGFASDIMKSQISYPLWFIPSLLLCAAGYSVLYTVGSIGMMMATGLVGFGNGIGWAVLPTIVCDVWGFKNFGSNMAVLGLFPALGGFIYSNLITGFFYRRYSTDGGNNCDGSKCFQWTFGISALSCAASLAFIVFLWWRTRRLYKTLGKIDRQVDLH
eukprot:TRINITY_DN5090_c0_g2_i1.p1 TRINITY_DN5090_c0_g2~~TRINITY_DN5090_c0_g2_i1.p1  ORF type:complete len:480 (-),score=100.47 TRINITY_DN5090_c0_g2_i1:44-1483(-)